MPEIEHYSIVYFDWITVFEAARSQYNFVSCFADGTMMLFGAEIFNNFSNRGYMCTYDIQAAASGNTQVFAHFSPKISTFRILFSGAVPSFQAD